MRSAIRACVSVAVIYAVGFGVYFSPAEVRPMVTVALVLAAMLAFVWIGVDDGEG